MKKFGLSLEKDAGYSKLIVITASILSGLLFAPTTFLGILTAQWKAEYGLPQSTASIHQRVFWGFFYLGTALMSQLYAKLSARVWLIIGATFQLFAYCLLILVKFVPVGKIIILQVIFGVIGGLGGGMCMTSIYVTPQGWLDKSREIMNPLLLMGAPVMSVIMINVGQLLVDIYSWIGALLIFIGIVCQNYIFLLFIMDHPDAEKKEKSDKMKLRDYRETFKHSGSLAFLSLMVILNGCILASVSSEIQNVAYEIGIPTDKAGTIALFSMIGEIFWRPTWSFGIRWIGIPNSMIFVCSSYLLSQIIFAASTTYAMLAVGLLVHSCATSGLTGFKPLVWIDLVSRSNLTKVIMLESISTGTLANIFPMVIAYIATEYQIPHVGFYISCGIVALALFPSVYVQFQLRKPFEKQEHDCSY